MANKQALYSSTNHRNNDQAINRRRHMRDNQRKQRLRKRAGKWTFVGAVDSIDVSQ